MFCFVFFLLFLLQLLTFTVRCLGFHWFIYLSFLCCRIGVQLRHHHRTFFAQFSRLFSHPLPAVLFFFHSIFSSFNGHQTCFCSLLKSCFEKYNFGVEKTIRKKLAEEAFFKRLIAVGHSFFDAKFYRTRIVIHGAEFHVGKTIRKKLVEEAFFKRLIAVGHSFFDAKFYRTIIAIYGAEFHVGKTIRKKLVEEAFFKRLVAVGHSFFQETYCCWTQFLWC